MKNTVVLIIISIVLFACEKTIRIDIPDEGRKLVLNSFFAADSVLQINLLKSRYILDPNYGYEKVSNADVRLYEEGNFIEELQETGDRVYLSNYILKKNKKYLIEVNADGFPSLKAESYVPDKTEIEKIAAYITKDEEGYEVLGFTLDFKDNPDKENYYFIQVREFVTDYLYYDYETFSDTIVSYTNLISLYSSDPSVYSDDWYLSTGIVVSDQLFNGDKYSLKFYSYDLYYQSYDEYGNPIEGNAQTKYYVYFYSISKDYYLYYKSLSKHMEAQDEFFMEPVQVYNNVEKGFGIFAGYSLDVDSTELSY